MDASSSEHWASWMTAFSTTALDLFCVSLRGALCHHCVGSCRSPRKRIRPERDSVWSIALTASRFLEEGCTHERRRTIGEMCSGIDLLASAFIECPSGNVVGSDSSEPLGCQTPTRCHKSWGNTFRCSEASADALECLDKVDIVVGAGDRLPFFTIYSTSNRSIIDL